jgi:hypothetical protein
MNVYSGRAYWTHFGPQGWYMDSVLQGRWLRQVQGGANATGMTISGSGPTASIEAGDPFRVAPSWTIEPQAQAIYHVALGSGRDAHGLTSFGASNDLQGVIRHPEWRDWNGPPRDPLGSGQRLAWLHREPALGDRLSASIPPLSTVRSKDLGARSTPA